MTQDPPEEALSDPWAKGARSPTREVWSIGGVVFDPALGTVAGPEGELRLRPKTAAVLGVLAASAGRLVPREELIEAVWPEVFVTDDNLTQCVTELRRALGRGLAASLLTIPRRGYLLGAPVRRIAPPAGGGVASCSESRLEVLEARIAVLERLLSKGGTSAAHAPDCTCGAGPHAGC